jgi:hypothetical protein
VYTLAELLSGAQLPWCGRVLAAGETPSGPDDDDCKTGDWRGHSFNGAPPAHARVHSRTAVAC